MFVFLPIVVAVCLPVADEPVFSGPQPGEALTSFEVIGVLGERLDQKIDLVADAAGKPTVIVFVHERTRPAFGLANVVMRLVEKYGAQKLVGGLVYLTDDPTETVAWLRRVAQHLPKDGTVGVSADGHEGPGAYGLNRNVALTIVIAKDSKVVSNFALVQPSLEVDGPRIFKAIADVLGEKEVAKISDLQPQSRDRMAMKGKKTPQDDSAAQRDPMLRSLLSPLIQKDATDAEVEAAATKVEAYAAKHPDARQQIGDIARKIIAAEKLANYGTKKCQEYLTKWAKEFRESPGEVKADKE